MALRDIIGQEKAVSILLRTLRKGMLASSYLFAGESGIGKKITAINFAKAVNCLKKKKYYHLPNNNIDSCDECSSCKKIDAGVHPDCLFVLPKGGQIRIEEIRAIDDRLALKPYEGEKKVIIIDDADKMNVNASNAFLKTLEEPPRDSLIILISSKYDNLPDTILSRCMRINFMPLNFEKCKGVIEKIFDLDKKKSVEIPILTRLSLGRPGLIISGDILGDRLWFINLLKKMLNTEKDNWTSKEEMEKWFDLLLLFLRDMAILKITQDEKVLVNSDIKEYLQKLSNRIDLKNIINIYEDIIILQKYIRYNLNKSLTWNYTSSLLIKKMGAENA